MAKKTKIKGKEEPKQLYELVKTESFSVRDVECETSKSEIYPDLGSQVIGQRIETQNGGYASRLVLKVEPDNKESPIETLVFEGCSIVRGGDRIIAKVPLFDKKTVGPDWEPLRQRNEYYARGARANESAIEIAILSSDGDVVRTDRAVDYHKFVK